MTYAEKLQDPRWQKKRLEILERDNWRCQLCNDDKSTLHIHHQKYKGEPWDAPNTYLITYCKHCHSITTILFDWTIFRVSKFPIDSERIHIIIACTDNSKRSMIGSMEYYKETDTFQWFDIIPTIRFPLIKEYMTFLEEKV